MQPLPSIAGAGRLVWMRPLPQAPSLLQLSWEPLPHEGQPTGARLACIYSIYFMCKLRVALHSRRRPSPTPRRHASKPPPVPAVAPPILNSRSLPVPKVKGARLRRRPSRTPRRQPSQTSRPCPHVAALFPRGSPSRRLPRRLTGLPVQVGVFS
jgi:hypothetical protein